MVYPKYYKNGKRFTCIKSKAEFVEVNTLRTVNTITFGSNEHYVSDAYKNDNEIPGEVFFDELNKQSKSLCAFCESVKQIIISFLN